MRHFHPLRLFTVLLLCGALFLSAMPVYAEATSDLDTLFARGIDPSEALYVNRSHVSPRRTGDDGDLEYKLKTGRSDLHTLREVAGEVAVDRDVTLTHDVWLLVPEGAVLTIDRGVTVTVHGQLHIDGELINNGTIILGETNRVHADNNAVGGLLAKGSVTSSGSIQVRNGQISVDGGILENSGTISVTNTREDLTAIRSRNGEDEGGHIANTGTITLGNTAGTGIRVDSLSTFTNSGTITKTSRSTITGVITEQ